MSDDSRSFLIWSDYWKAWFRPKACGYTADIAAAGVFRDRGVEASRERKVYYDEAREELLACRTDLVGRLSNLTEIENALVYAAATETRERDG